MSVFVQRLHVDSFRGIPHAVDLPLPTSAVPTSILIHGANGTGKSSLVDAVEFGLQARIHRSQHFDRPSIPSPFSLVSPSSSSPTVSITLSDDTVVTRTIHRDETAVQFDSVPHPSFAVSPMILRRSDILRFWSTPESHRQIFFRDFLQDWTSEPWEELTDVQQETLLTTRLQLKAKRRALAQELANMTNVPYEDVPVVDPDLDHFVRQYVYGGMSGRQRAALRKKGVTLTVNKDVKKLTDTLRSHNQSIKRLRRKLRRVGSPNPNRYLHLQDLLTTFSKRLTSAFARTSPSAALVESIELIPGRISPTSLSLDVSLVSGTRCSPEQVFSEANLDLLSFLIVLTVAEESARRGQARVFVLDDVFQSIDASIRLRVMDYLFTEFRDWQLVFTVHDRLWKEQLLDLCRRHSRPIVCLDLLDWSHQDGPTIRGASVSLVDRLRLAIPQGTTREICALAGPILEELCDELSHRLPVSVQRRRGDRYSIGDLWPGVRKQLRRSELADDVEDVSRWLHLRNMIGAHYNAWAEGVAIDEARAFGRAVLKLHEGVHCMRCRRWIASISVGQRHTGSWRCRCGSILVT